MRIELDLSPTLINQTAISHIGRDAAEALVPLAPSLIYFRERCASEPTGLEATRLKTALFEMVDAASRDAPLPAPLLDKPNDVPDRRVLLDPLYALFYDLRREDIVMILDLSVVTSPQWHNPAVAKLYTLAFTKIASIQPKLLAISQNTADSYVANYGYPRRDIEVVRLYVPEHLKRREGGEHYTPPKPFFLFVGSLEARKNVAGAIRAFGLSGLRGRGFEFIVAGGNGYGVELAEAAASRTPGVRLYGRVSDERLRTLYRNATGFLYPSYLEGFGVPLLEALQYGIPAVASVTGACPEVGGDLVAYCDPDDHEAIAAEVVKIADMSLESRAAFATSAARRVDEEFGREAFQRRFRRVVEEP